MDIGRALQQAVSPVVLQVHQNGNRHLSEWRLLFAVGSGEARGVGDAAPYGCIIDGAVGRTGSSTPTEVYLAVCRGGALLPTVVPTDWRALSHPPIGALPRTRLASSATGGASPISPPTGGVEPRPYGSGSGNKINGAAGMRKSGLFRGLSRDRPLYFDYFTAL